MALYYYKARINPQEITSGTIEAESAAAVIASLKRLNYYPLAVSPLASRRQFFLAGGFNRPIQRKDLVVATRQLANLIEAGLPIVRGLSTLINQIDNTALKVLFEEVRAQIQKGTTLSASLSRYPRYFSAVDVNMIKSAEAAGNLDQVLTELADLKEEGENLRAKIVTAMSYPLLLLAVGGITIFVLLSFVIPRFMLIFQDLGQMLPWVTQVMLGLSNFFSSYWAFFLIFAAGLFIIAKNFFTTAAGRQISDALKLKLPLLGTFIREAETARFSRTLAVLLKNGVPIVSGIRIVAGTMENSLVARHVAECGEALSRGERLSQAIKSNPYFSPVVKNMIGVGEESGRLEAMLFKVSEYFRQSAERKIDTMVKLVEPLLILCLGLVIGFIVFAMLLPIFQLDILIK